MAENPWELIARSQRAAAGLMSEALSTVVEMGRTGVTHPDEAVKQVAALAQAVGELAGSTAQPLEMLLASQRQLAETMGAFAVLQRQLADVMETAAANHAAIVQALELMSSPVLGVARKLRHEDSREEEAPEPPPAARTRPRSTSRRHPRSGGE